MRAALFLFLVACGQDIKITASSKCNGLLEEGEESVDSPFDLDGDGYFDGNNADCVEAYVQVDCDDSNEGINPSVTEQSCSGIDEDCDPATLDAPDADGDGVDACLDCADRDASVAPGNAELACDSLDNDCD
ncbi:MAG TPA: MopE-related protein, partial [Myxococcota bacterium]|nr:MopE-related protein [Myxococcota bacterium]